MERVTIVVKDAETIIVKCSKDGRQVYVDAFPLIPEKQSVKVRHKEWQHKKLGKPLSVLILGIDSVSRLNLMRAMPNTTKYLHDNNWFELAGYNKVREALPSSV